MPTEVNLTNETINGKHSYFLEYYNKIFRDGWVAGYEMKKVLSNIYEDLIEDRYDYDVSEAHLRIDFAETFCVQTKNKFHGKPIKFLLWQKARKEVTFSMYIKGTNCKKRRFQQVLEMVARKNGKSTDKSSEGDTDLFIGGGGLDICCSSNDDAQADLVFQELNNMRLAMDPKQKRTKQNRKGIFNRKNQTKIFKISDKTQNKEGRNIVYAYIDEIHEMKDNTIFMSIWQSCSIAENPLVYEITTEGMVDDGYLDKRLIYARKVLNGEIEDESLLVWLYTQDSEDEIWEDEESWYKSNPSLGAVKSFDFLRKNVEKARVDRESRAFILCKDFNIKQNNAISWLLEEEIASDETFSLEEFRNFFYIGGLDLSETTDLTSFDMMFIKYDKVYFKTMYFIPESKANGDLTINNEKKNYREWERKGYVTILPGTEVNYDAIVQYMWDVYQMYNIKPFKIGYDQWHAKGLIKEITYRFGEDLCEKVRMDFSTLSNPMRSLSADLKNHIVNYDSNEISRWCLKNVAVKTNNIGQIMPIKVQGKSGNRIDGALSKIICYAVKSMYYSDFTILNKSSIINMEDNNQITSGGE